MTQFDGNTYDSSAREFALVAVFNHTDGGTSDEMPVRFNPDVDNWQYAAAPIIADQAYSSITVYLAYDHNANTVYFDGIQLYKEQFGNSYTYDEDGNIVSVVDLQKKNTTYEYDANNNLTKMLQDNVAKMSYTYDAYHNVKKATSAEGLVYSFTYDTYGNNTKVAITGNGVTMESSATYANGNRLATTTDAAGKVTTYSYNANTNVLEWVKYPGETAALKTSYTYDEMYRLASAAAHTGRNILSANYTYTNDYLTGITTGSGTTYSFTYGDFGLRDTVKVGNKTLASYNYTERNNYLDTLAYGNGNRVKYIYDNLGRVTKEIYQDDDDTVSYQYNNDGALATVTDSGSGRKRTYYYDFTDRLLMYIDAGTGYGHSVKYAYDDRNNVTALIDNIGGSKLTTWYTYDDDNRITKVTVGTTTTSYTYDELGRLSSQTVNYNSSSSNALTKTYTYRIVDEKATGQVESVTYSGGLNRTYTYTYDDNGNITKVSDGTKETRYVYDKENQLLREDNQAANKTWGWVYDAGGNITIHGIYAYTLEASATLQSTVSYGYGDSNWKDLLTSFNGQTITYDNIGNPLTDGTWTYTWEHGRELARMTSGNTTWNFIYDADGMRTSRSNGTTDYDYVYVDSQLVQMTVNNSTTLRITYDANGPLYVDYNGTIYYYVTNLQGDVIALVTTSGTPVVEYTYDAWGKILSTGGTLKNTLGEDNPLRYRGYIYDRELGLYYLQSRYYNPVMARFINADDVDLLGANGDFASLNLFVYCGNNPAMREDSEGESWQYAMAGGGTLMAGVSWSTVGTSVLAALGSITPVGWIVIGTVVVTTAVVVGVSVYNAEKTTSSNEADPYARPGQKKQGRERKNKARKSKDWKPRSNPKPPKKHTPGRDHRRYK